MDIDFKPSISIVNLPISNPIHAPCPDMAGCVNFDPAKTQRSLDTLAQIRKKFSDKFPKKRKSRIPARFRQASYGGA